MSDSDHSDTLSTISTVSSLTSSDRFDSPPPYSPASPRIFADSKLSDFEENVDESLSSTLISSSTTSEPTVSSPSSSVRHVSPVRSPPEKMKNTRHKATHGSHEHERTRPSPRSNRSSPRARPPRVHPPHSPVASSPPPHPLRSSFRPNPPPSPPSFPPPIPCPPPNMHMSSNSWMHPGQGFSVHQSASPFGASQSINFHGPPVMPPQRFVPHNQYPANMNFSNNMGMSGMEEMRRGMENMRRTMQHDMEQMHNSMRQAHVNMNSAFHDRPHRHTSGTSRRDHNTGNMVVVGNQSYVPDRPHGTVIINNAGGRGGAGGSMVSVNANGVQVGQNSVGWGSGPGSHAVSVSSTGGGHAVSQTYVGSDGSRHTYNSYQGL